MEYEYVLLQKRGVKVYAIPPITSNKGHYLDSWKNKITEVNLKVVGKGHKCTVYLNNPDGTLFATAPIPERYDQAVVKCVDSSRGFALKLQDPSGKSAWIGISFTERNDSFDFQACFQDFEKNRDMEINPQKYAAENKPTQDFSLKKGEKIVFNVGGNAKPKSNFTGDFKLAPPPGSNSFGLPPPQNDTRPAPKVNQPQTQAGNNNAFDSFGNFGDFGQSNNTASTQGNAFNQGFGFPSAGALFQQGQAQQQTTQSKGNDFDLLGDINFSAQPTTTAVGQNQFGGNQNQFPNQFGGNQNQFQFPGAAGGQQQQQQTGNSSQGGNNLYDLL